MALTPSTMLPLGTQAPNFDLEDAVSLRRMSLSHVKGPKGLWVMFICNHCPYVVHIREVLVQWAHRALDLGVGVVAINSNSVETHPQDGPQHMKTLALAEKWRFPFLFDATQEVAQAYHAACTPDLFLFDSNLKLYYRGQFDGSRPGNKVPVTGQDFGSAFNALLSGAEAPSKQVPSMGCNIKWRPGHAPSYFG